MLHKNFQVFVIFQWIQFSHLSQEEICQNEVPKDCGLPTVQPNLLSRLRIVGGSEAIPNSWPWQLYLESDLGKWYHLCGASVLTNCYAITAAHCLENSKEHEIRVIAGYQKSKNYWQSVHRVTRIHVHPDSVPDFAVDIALLKVDPPFRFSRNVTPICLPKDPPVEGAKGVAVGWGLTEYDGVLSSDLKQVELPLVSNDRCKQFNPKVDLRSEFCAGDVTAVGDSTCQGDSGGPFVTRPGIREFYLTGIIKSGFKCGVAKHPSIFTNVFPYTKWITGIIGSASDQLKIECGKFDGNKNTQSWLLSLRKSDNLDIHQCNGVLIRNNWIITTPRCINKISYNADTERLRIFSDSTNVEDVRILKIVCNPEGAACLLKINSNLTLMPICLQTSSILPNVQCTVGGWKQDAIEVISQNCPNSYKTSCSIFKSKQANLGYLFDVLTCPDITGRLLFAGLYKNVYFDNSSLAHYFDVHKNLEWISGVINV